MGAGTPSKWTLTWVLSSRSRVWVASMSDGEPMWCFTRFANSLPHRLQNTLIAVHPYEEGCGGGGRRWTPAIWFVIDLETRSISERVDGDETKPIAPNLSRRLLVTAVVRTMITNHQMPFLSIGCIKPEPAVKVKKLIFGSTECF